MNTTLVLIRPAHFIASIVSCQSCCSQVCRNPSIFSSPLLVVRLNGKYYSWAAACPIVMTIIAYQKPLSIVSSGLFVGRIYCSSLVFSI